MNIAKSSPVPKTHTTIFKQIAESFNSPQKRLILKKEPDSTLAIRLTVNEPETLVSSATYGVHEENVVWTVNVRYDITDAE